MKRNFQKLMKDWDLVPLIVRIYVLVFLCFPFYGTVALSLYPETFLNQGFYIFVLDLLILFLLPLILCYVILKKHPITLLFYLFHCIVITAEMFIFWDIGSDGSLFKWGLSILMILGGLFLFSKDFLLPLLSNEQRTWRKNPRYTVNRLVRIRRMFSQVEITCLLRNVSETGIALVGYQKDIKKLRDENKRIIEEKNKRKSGKESDQLELSGPENVALEIRSDKKMIPFQGHISWARDVADHTYLGIHGHKAHQLAYICDKFLHRDNALGFLDTIGKAWARNAIRRTVLALWVATMLTNVIAPACGRIDESNEQFDEENFAGEVPEGNKIPLSIQFGSIGLNLTSNPTNVQANVQGCASGYQPTIAASSGLGNVDLYDSDRNCRIVISTFDIGSESFLLEPGHAFNTEPGGVNPFVGNQGSEVQLVVIEQLGDVLQGGGLDNVQFQFHQMKAGMDQIIEIDQHIIYAHVDKIVVTEGTDTEVTFTFSQIAEANTNALTIDYQLIGTASASNDYQPVSGSISIPKNQNYAKLVVTLTDDSLAEPSENLVLDIIESSNYTHWGDPEVTILDNDGSVASSNLALRFNNNGIQESGGLVTSWLDTSTSNIDAIQPDTNLQPTFMSGSFGAYNSIQFDGFDDLLEVPSNSVLDSAGPYYGKTLHGVINTSSDITSRQIIYEQGGQNRGFNIYIEAGKLYVHAYNLTDDDGGINTPWNSNVFISGDIFSNSSFTFATRFSQSSGQLELYISGELVGSAGGINALYGEADGIGLGRANSGTYYHDNTSGTDDSPFSGDIAELLVYNEAQSGQNLQEVLNYLVFKYDLQTKIVNISVTDQYLLEGSSSGVLLTFSLNRTFGEDTVLDFSATGLAENGLDYTELPSQITIEANTISKSIIISAYTDQLDEENESLIISLLPNSEYILGTSTQTLTILDSNSFKPGGDAIIWFNSEVGLSVSGNKVGGWFDQVGSSEDVIQNSGKKKPQLVSGGINGIDSLNFDGNDDFMKFPNSSVLDNLPSYNAKSNCVVFETSNTNIRQVIIEAGTSQRGWNLYIDSGTLYAGAWNTTDDDNGQTTPWNAIFVSTSVGNNSAYQTCMAFDQVTNQIYLMVNGVIVDTATGIGKLFDHNNDAALGKAIGTSRYHDGSTGSGFEFSGEIAEVILYNGFISGVELEQLTDYFSNKY